VIVIDEYLAVDVARGEWPDGLPDEDALAVLAITEPIRTLTVPSGATL
jgi:hypothetical protein